MNVCVSEAAAKMTFTDITPQRMPDTHCCCCVLLSHALVLYWTGFHNADIITTTESWTTAISTNNQFDRSIFIHFYFSTHTVTQDQGLLTANSFSNLTKIKIEEQIRICLTSQTTICNWRAVLVPVNGSILRLVPVHPSF